MTIFNSPATWAAIFHLLGITKCVLYIPVSKQQYGCQCLGFITCAQVLMQVIAHGAVQTPLASLR